MILKHALALGFAAAGALALALSLEAMLRDKIARNRALHESRLLKETLADVAYDRLVAADLSSSFAAPAPESLLAMWRAERNGRTAATGGARPRGRIRRRHCFRRGV